MKSIIEFCRKTGEAVLRCFEAENIQNFFRMNVLIVCNTKSQKIEKHERIIRILGGFAGLFGVYQFKYCRADIGLAFLQVDIFSKSGKEI